MGILWYLMLMSLPVHQSMESKRLVMNTTCLELAKPSNQLLRMTCQPGYYHCLLDENYTREFEVCTVWMWIHEGDCAYFNSYGQGNIDRKECTPNINLTCSPKQYPSYENLKYTACYAKKHSDSDGPRETTSSSHVTGIYDRENSTSSPEKSEETYHVEMQALASVLGILFSVLSLCVFYFVCRHRKRLHDKKAKLESVIIGNAEEKNPLIGTQDGEERAQDDKSEVEANKSGEKTSHHSEKSENNHLESVTKSEERENNKTDTDANNTSTSEEHEEFEEASSPLISPSAIRKGSVECPESDNSSDAESTGVFDDTAESLQKGVRTTDKKEMELCQELYDLLHNEGRELTQEVLRLVIIRTVGKTPEELVTNGTTENLKTILPEDSHGLLSTQREYVTSIHVLYGLIQLTPGIEPKSGWGEPVKGSDTGIGDDVERLYRIFYICMGISDHKAISVDNYVRLVNIMLTAVTRLDCDGELKDRYKVLADKLKTIKNPNWSQSMFRMFNGFVKRWSPL